MKIRKGAKNCYIPNADRVLRVIWKSKKDYPTNLFLTFSHEIAAMRLADMKKTGIPQYATYDNEKLLQFYPAAAHNGELEILYYELKQI